MATHSCSCLENPRGGGVWWGAIYGVAQSRTRLKRLSSSSSSTKSQLQHASSLLAAYPQLQCVNSELQHVASSSLTQGQTWAPCIGSLECQPLDHRNAHDFCAYFLHHFCCKGKNIAESLEKKENNPQFYYLPKITIFILVSLHFFIFNFC